MHASVMDWLREVRPRLGDIKSWDVLEVGSYIENGSARDVYGPQNVASYVGVDMREGPGVDVRSPAAALPFRGGSFDLVISTEMLEHDPRPWLSVEEMSRVLRPGGHLLLTARGFDAYGGYPEHPCPMDYWRFNQESFIVLLGDAGFSHVDVKMDPGSERPGVFAHATK